MHEMQKVIVNGIPISVTAGMRWLYETRDRALGRRHCNAEYEVNLVLEGKCAADTEEESFLLGPGQGVIIAPGHYHYFKAEPGPFLRFSLRFHLPESTLSRTIRTQLPTWRLFTASDEICSLCRSLYDLYEKRDRFWQELYGNQLTGLLLRLLRLLELGGDTPERAPAVREDDRASRINRFIEDHLSEDTGIDQLAAHMHLSRRQMVRVVREIYGIGFREKLLYARMDRASWLLRTTTDTISRIVETVGYQSQTAFQRAFREHFGMTPTQYRRQFSGESSKRSRGPTVDPVGPR